jgi:hypothetical protein
LRELNSELRREGVAYTLCEKDDVEVILMAQTLKS